ncbi:hypothetical protein SKAU_G00098570 [Synaphobranchus kaupii]|uniref:Telomere zinc finger-associated protein n=1 Tax=Synaphobranchus kaupii TaxID=118154 RepID=A0A9Q1J6W7_SYNKA|nr:hypothetical protein SKAU_G00098570 [Synaphobranchus kaupii]
MAVPNAHAQRVLSSLNQQRGLGRFCDAMLSLGSGQVYLAHRNVLACFSDLFQETYTTNTTCMEVCLPVECPTEGLELVLDFVYTGELKVDSVNLENVRSAAVSLSVPDAINLCQSFTCQQSPPRRPKTEELGAGDESYRGLNAPSAPQDYSSTETPAKGKQKPRLTPKPRAKAASTTSKQTVPIPLPTTTTRSGRTVKGPSRLLRDSPTPPLTPRGGSAKKADAGALEGGKGGAEEGSQRGDRPVTEPEVGGASKPANENEDEDGGEAEGPQEDTDDEYLPHSLPTATGGPQRAKRRGRGKVVNKENGEGVGRDPKRNSVQCPTCHKTFLSKYYLKVHNRRHTGEKPFECSKCGKCYYRKENLMEHEARNCLNRAGVVFSCSMCPMTFKKRLELRFHTVTHTGEMPNKCTSCPEQFMQKKDLKIHLIKVHGAPKPHACSLCPKCFLSRTELRLHEASKHRGEKLFVCEECGHRASSRNGLQMHIKAIHRNERPFVCEFCNHAFTQKANLNMHLRTHTGEKPFQCHLCGKTFRTQASLDKHHRTHTGERPFRCEFCDQRFTEKGPLLRHVASKHQEGRPHYCHICSKTFKAIEQLRVHVRRHKGMRKFECTQCGYKFTRQAHLRRHSQIHNRVENYSPRQRRLRNLVVEDEKGAEGVGPAVGDVISVMIQPGAVVVEEVVSTQGAGPSEAGEEGEGEGEAEGEGEGEVEGQAFTVADVMEQTLLVTGAYPIHDATVVTEEMAEGGDEDKA